MVQSRNSISCHTNINTNGVFFATYLILAPQHARFIGPTGDYLIGFIPAAFVVGWLAERGWTRRIWTTALAMLIGCAVYYAVGLSWLAHFVPADKVFAIGLYPFIIGDLLKLALAASAVPLATRWLEKHFKNREQ